MPRDATKVSLARIESRLRAMALEYPGAVEEFPWGERVIKVAKKIFLFVGCDEGGLHLSVKLPASGVMALSLPFASPTAYNLGKAGWVSARLTSKDDAPFGLLEEWIDESYRAVAPRKFVKQLDESLAARPVKKMRPVRWS
jgi:predicted DNA-binding protein (MmcQ/YjbR family)